ncbi:diguanylate cyclase domain-containing protein [uncultured Subdoligranulum sp.]|uniref:diguanylate cyclase domain-containing protein n=1 Tax=uncultured Subdoligranulum sp. TaxID=512298 RepID=UPI00260A1E22|nr:diguanylate cyclase [uncultured Subdoligranulum sp.]
MKLDYTKEELAVQVAALEQLFSAVRIVDAYRGVLLDPVTLEAKGSMPPIPPLDEEGRAMQLAPRSEKRELLVCQGIQVEGRPLVLALYCPLPKQYRTSTGAQNSYDRALTQYREDMRRDYVTGVYNSNYLNGEYRDYAEKQAMQGQPVGVVMLRVNEYWALRSKESQQAAECCLNTAAGILQLAVGTDREHAVLARLEEGLFAAVTVGTPAARLAQNINAALESSRRVFSITLARRGTFTVSVASAEWGETSSWEMMLALAQQRL